MKLATVLSWCLTLSIQAGTVDDLRVTLGKLQGQGMLRGTYAVDTWTKGGKGKDLDESTGTASAWVEEDGSGLRIQWDRALLRRAEEGFKSPKGTNKTESPALGIESASVLKIHGAVNFAPKLARLLATGRLKLERNEVFQGKPSQLIEVQLTPPDSEDEDKPKENTYNAKVWLGADGVPLGATLTHTLKAGMLFISVEQSMKEEFTFSHVANRLVILRREETQSGKGMGFEFQLRTTSTFTIK